MLGETIIPNAELFKEVTTALKEAGTHRPTFKAIAGFDGFVDFLQKAVQKKVDGKNQYFQTITDFANHLAALKGRSGQVEMVTHFSKLGGNAPIFSAAMSSLGIDSTCIGSMGSPDLHPVFSPLSHQCECFSLADPGVSRAVEFTDGKIIFSDLAVFDLYDWAQIRKHFKSSDIIQRIHHADVVALLDWVNLPHASNIWRGLLNDVLAAGKRHDYVFFFDLCDPSKKPASEIGSLLDLISEYSKYGRVTLGLNENETYKIWLALNGFGYEKTTDTSELPDLKKAGEFLFERMNIETLLIHPVDRTLAFTKDESIEVMGRVVINPKILTGAGDNLNAGYCAGVLMGLSLPATLLLSMAASGCYVLNGEAGLMHVERYLSIWSKELATGPIPTERIT